MKLACLTATVALHTHFSLIADRLPQCESNSSYFIVNLVCSIPLLSACKLTTYGCLEKIESGPTGAFEVLIFGYTFSSLNAVVRSG